MKKIMLVFAAISLLILACKIPGKNIQIPETATPTMIEPTIEDILENDGDIENVLPTATEEIATVETQSNEMTYTFQVTCEMVVDTDSKCNCNDPMQVSITMIISEDSVTIMPGTDRERVYLQIAENTYYRERTEGISSENVAKESYTLTLIPEGYILLVRTDWKSGAVCETELSYVILSD